MAGPLASDVPPAGSRYLSTPFANLDACASRRAPDTGRLSLPGQTGVRFTPATLAARQPAWTPPGSLAQHRFAHALSAYQRDEANLRQWRRRELAARRAFHAH